jgi:glycosyltransferase involved in cell wall biosynthesis
MYMALRLRRNLDHARAIAVTAGPERDLMKPLQLRNDFVIEPLGVDLTEFDSLPAKGWLRERHPEIGPRPIVLFLGRIHHKKGLDLLLPAFARAALGDAVLVLAGPCEPIYLAELRARIGQLGLQDRVVFTGLLLGPERIQAYVDSSLFVLPSYQENFGIAVVEAAAAGCPVLISDRVNIFDDIRSSGVGGVISLGVDELVHGLETWMGDPAALAEAARRGPAFARARYDWNQIAKRWAGHYAGLLATQR